MYLSSNLELRQAQTLVMTPQLQQAIKLLQMSHLELHEFIQGELEKNPLLNVDAEGEASVPINDNTVQASDQVLKENTQALAAETFDTGLGLENIYADQARADIDRRNMRLGDSTTENVSYENTLSTTLTLRAHLISQVGIIPCTPIVEAMALHLIDYLDDAGYLRIDAGTLCKNLCVSPRVLEDAVDLLHQLEPAGVGARTLAECLKIQLQDRGQYSPVFAVFLENLELLARHELGRLRRMCKVSHEELLDMMHLVLQLNPKPGARFVQMPTQSLVPDVFVRSDDMGLWLVELNSDTLPKVLLDRTYIAQLTQKFYHETNEYVKTCVRNANWLLKSLDQRAKTILKVAIEIVRHQDEFFAYGITRLRPMNLKEIADRIDMHESTVSRVTANKYISTPRGVFEMKFFFTAAISSMDGQDQYSAEAVRYQIKSLIDAETAGFILSDDKIMEILRVRGIDIARRTVAKYREAMDIPSSVHRRRAKRSSLSVS